MASNKTTDEEEGGELVFAGSLAFSMTGRSKPGLAYDGVPERLILSFSRLKPFMGVSISKVFSGPLAHHFVATSTDGKVFTWGRNEDGQLGHGDKINRYNPTLIDISNVVSAACSLKHTLVCNANGKAWGFGSNNCGQLGVGCVSECFTSPKEVNFGGNAVQVATGKEHSCFVAGDGRLLTCGSPQHGCLGNGSEGKSLERAGKFTFANEHTPKQVASLAGIEMAQVACGAIHSIAADVEGRLWSWGFNGYGNLGLGHNKMQLSPQPVQFFHNVKQPKPDNVPAFMWRAKPEMRVTKICCGTNCCNVVANQEALYFWGIRKVSNEAVLKPKFVDGVQGWEVKTVAAGPSSTILFAESFVGGDEERCLIAWGLSPTHGELGYGKKSKYKSSSQPEKCKSLDGATILQVAMGYGYSLAIVKRDKVGKKLIAKCDVLDPVEPNVTPKEKKKRGAPKRKAGGKSKRAKK